ncbi:MAG: hypothetical protein KKA61_02975 [Nanoarchaeota archaeon]|nr:hypothetical protein [Nanoarchaeota archaeon]MBU4284401.1 hypothetical protein [Nanoarchaeota archaeon]MBU4493310.1 hypothetical protein [Nanoarchaeota archaeon]
MKKDDNKEDSINNKVKFVDEEGKTEFFLKGEGKEYEKGETIHYKNKEYKVIDRVIDYFKRKISYYKVKLFKNSFH